MSPSIPATVSAHVGVPEIVSDTENANSMVWRDSRFCVCIIMSSLLFLDFTPLKLQGAANTSSI